MEQRQVVRRQRWGVCAGRGVLSNCAVRIHHDRQQHVEQDIEDQDEEQHKPDDLKKVDLEAVHEHSGVKISEQHVPQFEDSGREGDKIWDVLAEQENSSVGERVHEAGEEHAEWYELAHGLSERFGYEGEPRMKPALFDQPHQQQHELDRSQLQNKGGPENTHKIL